MNNKLFNACLSFVFASSVFLNNATAQFKSNGDEIEKVGILWDNLLQKSLQQFNASEKDIETFNRFDEKPLTDLKIEFFKKMGKADKESLPKTNITKNAEMSVNSLYRNFIQIKQNYPSSVAEYEHRTIHSSNPCDSTGCTNIDFNTGNFSGWYGYYANHDNICTSNSVSAITGGALGAVTLACNDPTTAAYNSLSADYQLSITSGGYDAVVPTISRVSPWATGGHSVMLGDSTWVGYGISILEKTFRVTASTANLTYQYALLLENPIHCTGNQPLFTVAALDSLGDTIPNCGVYNVVSGYGIKGFDSTTYGGTIVYYRDWTIVNVPLKKYIGSCVTIIFQVEDCGQGGHFGYAYVDASCSPLLPITSSPNLCGQDSLSLTAPPGASNYFWWDSIPGIAIRGSDSGQTVWVDSAGTYYVIVTPVTGASCSDTLAITIGKEPGPPPHAKFKADTVCSGNPTRFINLSTDTALIGATFYWDFYNSGIYEDSNIIDPTWIYPTPGIYYVKLHTIYNGCGADTLIQILVEPTVNGAFSAPSVCLGNPTNFTFTGTGATSWSWNFGDPSTLADTSHSQSTSYTYTVAGTYTVTLISANGGPCPDTVKVVVHIDTIPHIIGLDTICSGSSDTLHASGGTTYAWSPGVGTNDTLIVTPLITRVFTVTIDGSCSATFTVTPVTAPTPSISASADSVCPGAPDTLFAHGATSYKWSTGQTTSSIVVNPTTSRTYSFTEYLGTATTCSSKDSITIGIITNVSAMIPNKDTVCAGSPAALTVIHTGGGAITSYKWSTGQSTTAITVTPDSTTTYYVVAQGTCNNDTVPVTVQVTPLPVAKISGGDTVCNGFSTTLSASGGTTYVWNNGATSTQITTTNLSNDTTIYLVAINGNCVDTTSLKLHVKFPPTVSVKPSLPVCIGSCTVITGSASGRGNTFSWSNGSTYDTVTICPTSDSTLYLYVTNGCKAPKVKTTINVFPINLYACCDQTIVQGNSATITAGQARTYTWIPAVDCLDPRCDSVKVTPSVTTSYTVSGVDSDGCADVRVVTIDVDIPCFDVVVPNVFTPNGDGVNDVFLVSTVNNYNQAAIDTVLKKGSPYYGASSNLNAYSISIYDRWGKEMYTSTNPDAAWDGTTKSGAKAADGVYYYIISATCDGTSGIKNTKKDGFVQLIRGK